MSRKKAQEKKREADSPFAKLRPLRDQLLRGDVANAENAPAPKALPTAPHPNAGPPPHKERRPDSPQPDTGASQVEADDAYRRLIAGAKPLDGRDRRVPRAADIPSRQIPPESPAEREAGARYRALVDDGVAFEAVRYGDRVEAARRDLSSTIRKRLHDGGFPVDASLDLHGLVTSAARQRLREFLHSCVRRRERCVRVVHGRGTHSPNGVAVLQEEVFHWLTGDLRGLVDATITAPLALGGNGATLVLLTKK